MGVCKQTLIDELDDFYGDDGRLKVTQQEVIDAMVRTYMKTPEYKKEHMDQEKFAIQQRDNFVNMMKIRRNPG